MNPFQEESKKLFDEQVEELKYRDWNKDWPTAQRQVPSTCSCGKRLEKPRAKGKILVNKCKQFPNGLVSSHNNPIRIDCECGICYIWSFPNVYKRTHRLSEMHMFVNSNGTLLIPERVF